MKVTLLKLDNWEQLSCPAKCGACHVHACVSMPTAARGHGTQVFSAFAMELAKQKWPDIAAMSKDTPVVIPIAALEQHGRHLPVFTDSLLLGEVIRRASERLTDRVLVAPLMWLGNSDHHLDFPGTLSAPPRLYLDLLVSLAETFITHGFRRMVFVNGHGGNDVPGKQAVFELRQRHRDRADLLLLIATYWGLGARPWEADSMIQQREMGHACEWETSMILRLAPSLVGDYRGTQPVVLMGRRSAAMSSSACR